MKQTALLSFALILGGTGLFAADPQLLNMAPPTTQMYAGINVEQAKTSQFGQFLLTNIPVDAGFQDFINSTGFDPRSDLREVLIVTTTPKTSGTAMVVTSGLLLAKGNFNLAKIATAAANDRKASVSTYAGAQLVTITEGDHAQALGLVDSSTAVAGNLDDVKAALDRRSSGAAIPADIMARINQLSTTEDIWSVSTANFGALPIPGAGKSGSAVLGNIQQASGGVKFGANVQLVGQAITGNPQDAASLGDVVKLLAQMVQMHGGSVQPPPGIANLLKSLNVSTDGNVVNLTLTLPEDQLESLFQMAETYKI